jgi:hypothetical protein
VGKPEGKKPLRRSICRRENIKVDLTEIGCGGMDWIDLAQDREHWQAVVKTVMNLQVPQNVGKYLSSFTRRTQLHVVSYTETLTKANLT